MTTRACSVCGETLIVQPRQVIAEELRKQWELSEREANAFNRREGDVCAHCGSSRRLWGLASTMIMALKEHFGISISRLADLREALRLESSRLRIWECNNLSTLHRHFTGIPAVLYSEFDSHPRSVPSLNLMDIALDDSSMDVIVMTDVLEHVPDISAALRELYRVMSPAGALMFTVPIIFSRTTRHRAVAEENGSLRHILQPSFHGNGGEKRSDMLVYHEFGGDFVDQLKMFFNVEIHGDAELPDGIGTVFVCTKRIDPDAFADTPETPSRHHELEKEVLQRSWFYPFRLPSGHITQPYIPEEIHPIHETRRDMMFRALAPLFHGHWHEARAIDLACNQGYYAMELAAHGCGYVLGVEAKPETVAEADLMRRCLGLDNVCFRAGDVLSLNKADIGLFDIVVMFGLLYHLENPIGALRIAKSFTKTVLLIETQTGHDRADLIDWGHSSSQVQSEGAFYVIDETGQGGNALAGITGIALCPSLNALKWILAAIGFPRVEVVIPPAGGYEQFESRKRVMVAAYI